MSTRFSSTAAAEEIVKDIRDGKYTDSASALGLLKQIVNDLPGTSVAREAQRLIDERYQQFLCIQIKQIIVTTNKMR